MEKSYVTYAKLIGMAERNDITDADAAIIRAAASEILKRITVEMESLAFGAATISTPAAPPSTLTIETLVDTMREVEMMQMDCEVAMLLSDTYPQWKALKASGWLDRNIWRMAQGLPFLPPVWPRDYLPQEGPGLLYGALRPRRF